MFITTYYFHINIQNNVTTVETYIVPCYATLHMYMTFKWNLQHPSSRRANELSRMTTHFHVRMCKKHIEMVISLRSLFWDVTLRTLAVIYRWFGTTYRNHLQGQAVLSLADGTNKLSLNVAK